LKLVDICIHCGDEGSSEYLFGQTELEEQNKTDGKQCYPICKLCLDEGKKVVAYPKKKTNQTQKEEGSYCKQSHCRCCSKEVKEGEEGVSFLFTLISTEDYSLPHLSQKYPSHSPRR